MYEMEGPHRPSCTTRSRSLGCKPALPDHRATREPTCRAAVTRRPVVTPAAAGCPTPVALHRNRPSELVAQCGGDNRPTTVGLPRERPSTMPVAQHLRLLVPAAGLPTSVASKFPSNPVSRFLRWAISTGRQGTAQPLSPLFFGIFCVHRIVPRNNEVVPRNCRCPPRCPPFIHRFVHSRVGRS